MPGTQGSTSLTGQHELTQHFQEEQSCQRNAFPKQSFSSGREAVLLPLISLTSTCTFPASKYQRDVLGDNDSPPGPKHNCDVRKSDKCLRIKPAIARAFARQQVPQHCSYATIRAPRNKAGMTCSTPALSTFTVQGTPSKLSKVQRGAILLLHSSHYSRP